MKERLGYVDDFGKEMESRVQRTSKVESGYRFPDEI